LGRGFGEVTTIKPPLPTDTLRNARRLRRDTTDAERRLWQHLRADRFDSLKFRRQHPIPPYIVDFCCASERLIVELDGSQHSEAIDAPRTRFLQSKGWRILRFWDNDVLLETEVVLDAIWSAVGDRTLSPTPLPAGEGLKSE
jgi:very-short-patch-repair endonuclease